MRTPGLTPPRAINGGDLNVDQTTDRTMGQRQFDKDARSFIEAPASRVTM
jgi:hypothetical protein